MGVRLVQGVTRSDYLVVPDPALGGTNIFPAGTYFWRVRAVHGDVLGPWSAGQSFTVAALPPTPPGLAISHIVAEPGSVSGGNSTQARVTLNMPAPPGGALIKIATDMPHAQTPTSVVIPQGKTDAIRFSDPDHTGAGRDDRHRHRRLRPRLAAKLARAVADPLGHRAQQRERGRRTCVVGTVTLLNPAPPGGVEVALVNNDSDLITLPQTILVPEGATGATFDVVTAPVWFPRA